MRYRICFVLVLAVACPVSSARAGEFVSPEGFTLTFPDDWKLAAPAETGKLVEAVKKKSRADPGIVAYIHGTPSEDVTPNINVIVRKGPIVVSPDFEKAMVRGLKQGIPKGSPVSQFKTSHFLVRGRTLFSVAYETDDPRQKKPLRVWVVMFPTSGGLCVMTCTALKSQWKEAGAVFKSSINSLRFE